MLRNIKRWWHRRKLSSKDSGVRATAVEALGRLGPGEAPPELVACLKDSSPGVRRAAIQALGQLRDPTAVDALVAVLQQRQGVLPPEAAAALGAIGDPRATGPLLRAMGTASELRRAAAQGLSGMGEARWVTLVQGNQDDWERLAKDDDPRALEPLLEALHGEVAVHERRAIAALLGNRKDPRALEPLIVALGDPAKSGQHHVRTSAASALASLGEPRWVELVKGDASDWKRLAGTKDPRVAAALLRLLKKGEPNEKAEAARALGELGTPPAVDALLSALGADARLSTAAAEALGSTGAISAIPALVKTLEEGRGETRYAAARSLERMGPAAFEPVLQLLELDSADDRTLAVRILGKLGDARAVEPLVRLLEDRTLAAEAESACVSLGAPVVERLLELFETKANVRERALRALGAIGDPRALPALLSALGKEPRSYEIEKALDAALQNRASLDTLLKDLSAHPPKLRGMIARALGRFSDEGAVAALAGLAADEDRSVCADALAPLWLKAPERAVALLERRTDLEQLLEERLEPPLQGECLRVSCEREPARFDAEKVLTFSARHLATCRPETQALLRQRLSDNLAGLSLDAAGYEAVNKLFPASQLAAAGIESRLLQDLERGRVSAVRLESLLKKLGWTVAHRHAAETCPECRGIGHVWETPGEGATYQEKSTCGTCHGNRVHHRYLGTDLTRGETRRSITP